MTKKMMTTTKYVVDDETTTTTSEVFGCFFDFGGRNFGCVPLTNLYIVCVRVFVYICVLLFLLQFSLDFISINYESETVNCASKKIIKRKNRSSSSFCYDFESRLCRSHSCCRCCCCCHMRPSSIYLSIDICICIYISMYLSYMKLYPIHIHKSSRHSIESRGACIIYATTKQMRKQIEAQQNCTQIQ